MELRIKFPPGRQTSGYFLFKLENVKDRDVQIDLIGDHPKNHWTTLNPVYAVQPDDDIREPDAFLADPRNFKTTPRVVRRKPNGTFTFDHLPQAANGPRLPYPETDRGHAWRFLPKVQPIEKGIRIRHRFTENHVYIAMRPPYTPKLCVSLTDTIAEKYKNSPDVKMHTLFTTSEGRPIRFMQIGTDPEKKSGSKPCILIYAREHPDEHDSSWVAHGVIDFLLGSHPDARVIRTQCIILVVPILDPDGAVANVYEHITKSFVEEDQTPVSIAWAAWFKAWVDAGHRLDVVINLHNVESNEGPHLFPALFEPATKRGVIDEALHRAIAKEARAEGFEVPGGTGRTGYMSTRLGGWLRKYYGTHHMLYEVNSQAPSRHLTLFESKLIGVQLVRGIVRHLTQPESKPLIDAINQSRDDRDVRWERYGKLRRVFLPSMSVFAWEQTCVVMPRVEAHMQAHIAATGEPVPGWLRPLYEE